MRDYLKKNEPADNSKINGFISTYNNTIHKETGVSPNEMQNNKALEIECIVNKLYEQANIENKSGYKLTAGDKVRLIDNKHTLKKTRYNVTHFILLSRISQGNRLQYLMMMDLLKLLLDQELYH
jgi:hypothetical protein